LGSIIEFIRFFGNFKWFFETSVVVILGKFRDCDKNLTLDLGVLVRAARRLVKVDALVGWEFFERARVGSAPGCLETGV
jgi:hypothetical protein